MSILIHNDFVRSHDFDHDLAKFLCCYAGLELGYYYETEDKILQQRVHNKCRPDVVLHKKEYNLDTSNLHNVLYIEVQKDIKPAWVEQKKQDYGSQPYCIIPLTDELVLLPPKEQYYLIKAWILSALDKPKDRNKSEHISQVCEQCGERFKDLRGHQYREKRRLEAKKNKL